MVNWISGHPPSNFLEQAWWVWDGSNIFLAIWRMGDWELAEPCLDFAPENITHYCALSKPDRPHYLEKESTHAEN